MEKMSTDLFHFGGDTWMILVDWYSNYSFAKNLGRTGGTSKVCEKLKNIFLNHGFCLELRSDGGPEYRETFRRWCTQAGIRSTLSSAYNSSGNARAEKKIQDVKNLMRKVKDAREEWLPAYSEWRNAPTVEGSVQPSCTTVVMFAVASSLRSIERWTSTRWQERGGRKRRTRGTRG
jgi:transposase InsO family protein